jgi:hypothetical protein
MMAGRAGRKRKSASAFARRFGRKHDDVITEFLNALDIPLSTATARNHRKARRKRRAK